MERIIRKIREEKLSRKLVRVDLKGGDVIRGILYGRYKYTAKKMEEGLFLITFSPATGKPRELFLDEQVVRNKVLDIGNSRMGNGESSKELTVYAEKLDKKRKEKVCKEKVRKEKVRREKERKEKERREEEEYYERERMKNKKKDEELRSKKSIREIKESIRGLGKNSEDLRL